MRWVFRLDDIITARHLDNAAKLMLTTGLIVSYSYLMENFISWYSGNTYESYMSWYRRTGPYAFIYWTVIVCNVILPQLLWSRRIRSSAVALFLISLVVQVGMWSERVMIVITSLSRDFMPSAWNMYLPTKWDWAILAGTIGIFFFLFLMFLRLLPLSSASELRELIHQRNRKPERAA
jgi:molybdopterin-containing oxidoreductase family membrane subunit